MTQTKQQGHTPYPPEFYLVAREIGCSVYTIDAAPELLEACKEAYHLMNNHGPTGNMTEHQKKSWRQNVCDLEQVIAEAEKV